MRFLKLVYSELKTQNTPGRIVLVIGAIAFALIPLLVTGRAETPTENRLIRFAGEVTLYNLIIRIVSIFRDRNTLDKNRTTYLIFNRKTVLAAKFLADVMIFIVFLTIAMIAGALTNVYRNKADLSGDKIEKLSIYIVSIIIVYITITFVNRYIITLELRYWRIVLLSLWNLISIIAYVAISATAAVLESERFIRGAGGVLVPDPNAPSIIQTVQDNKYIFALIPVLNIVTIPITFNYQGEFWTIAPMTAQITLLAILIWSPLSRNLKRYLTV